MEMRIKILIFVLLSGCGRGVVVKKLNANEIILGQQSALVEKDREIEKLYEDIHYLRVNGCDYGGEW
jgi:hypothetical protein